MKGTRWAFHEIVMGAESGRFWRGNMSSRKVVLTSLGDANNAAQPDDRRTKANNKRRRRNIEALNEMGDRRHAALVTLSSDKRNVSMKCADARIFLVSALREDADGERR